MNLMKHKTYFSFCFTVLFFTNANAQHLSPEQNKLLLNTKQGQIVLLPNFITPSIPLLHYQKIIFPGPQYIISDDPEYIRVPETIAIREKVNPGTIRLYLYNVNGVKEPNQIETKITALIKNTGKADMHLRMLKFSSQKPSTNYFKIAKQGLYDYFNSQPSLKIITIKPGTAIPIDAALEKNIVTYDQLVHGIYEFVIDQPGEVTVLQTNPSTTGAIANEQIKTIASSRHMNAGRGMFGVSNYKFINKDKWFALTLTNKPINHYYLCIMSEQQLRIVFMGTPDFAVASLDALVKAGFTIVGVITAPDKPAGRGMKLTESAVKKYAVEKNLHVLQPEKLRTRIF